MSQSKRRLNQNDCTITNPVVIRPILSSYVSGIVPLWRCPFGRCVQYLAGYSGPCTRSPTDQQVYLIWPNCRQQALRLAAVAVDQYFASIALRWVTWLSPITEFWYFISQNWLIIIPKVGVFGWHGCIFLERLCLEELQMINTPGLYWRLSLARHDAVATAAAAAPWRRIFHSLPK